METKDIIKNLIALESLNHALRALEGNSPRAATTKRKIEALRNELPATVLDHYDLRFSRGKKVIASAEGYICRACHISIPSGDRPRLKAAIHLFHCGNCGAYLYLPEPAAA